MQTDTAPSTPAEASVAATRLLEIAARDADEWRTEARAEADRIVADARAEAEKVRAELAQERQKHEAKVGELRHLESEHRERLRRHLTSVLEQVDATEQR
jgi:cell division septum initiation protein DivIVA